MSCHGPMQMIISGKYVDECKKRHVVNIEDNNSFLDEIDWSIGENFENAKLNYLLKIKSKIHFFLLSSITLSLRKEIK